MRKHLGWIALAFLLSACAEQHEPAPEAIIVEEPASPEPGPVEHIQELACDDPGDGIGGTGCPVE